MKYIFYFLLSVTLISATDAFAQKRLVENAKREAVLVPSTGDTTNQKRPCAIFNKSLRTISVRVEETVEIDNYRQTRTLVFSNLAPHEKRFVGSAGCDHLLMQETCKAYRILLSYYEDTAPNVMVSTKQAAPAAETESGAAAAASSK